MSGHLKDSLVLAIATELSDRLSGEVYASRRSDRAVPPYTVVVVKRMETELPYGNAWLAPVHVVHVTDMADAGGAEHDAKVREIQNALEMMPRNGVDVDNEVCIYGMTLDSVEDATDDDDETSVWADVFMLSVGVGRYTP